MLLIRSACLTLFTLGVLAGCSTPTAQPPKQTSAVASTNYQCSPDYSTQTIDVSEVYQDGEWVRDFYSGARQKVVSGKVDFTPAPGSEGLILIEEDNFSKQNFMWDNATVYFAITDRFANGRTDNDRSYGRKPDGAQEIGTFHGGDLAGLTSKLDYIAALGVNAIWISPPFEQMHGWVGGGIRGDFRHYGYHGYYIQDFTRLDANMGTERELREFVDAAHARGIRVLLDVVMNHPGYSTLQDMQTFDYGAIKTTRLSAMPENWGEWTPPAGKNFHGYHDNIAYQAPRWSNWWGKNWVRAGVGDYDKAPDVAVDPIRGSLAFLPDFKTESPQPVDLPVFLRDKKDTGAKQLADASVRDYLVTWLTRWVREFGIDGFRVDTVKHVEGDSWRQLKASATRDLEEYRIANFEKPQFTEPFWMVGEIFPHKVEKTKHFDQGFDAVINFDFQRRYAKRGADCLANIDATFSDYAAKLNTDPEFNVMTYISSHDTQLFSTSAKTADVQKRVAAPLLLTPGAVQIFYGDESMRMHGPSGSDKMQGTRSAMNWEDIDAGKVDNILNHWRKIGTFRNRHPAIGAGEHKMLSAAPYTFSRVKGADRVVIVSSEKPD